MAYRNQYKPLPRRRCEECQKLFRPWWEGQTKCFTCDKRRLLDKWAGPNKLPEIEVKEGEPE